MNGNVEIHVLFEKLTATAVLNFTRCHLYTIDNQWCSRKYLGTGAVQNISMVLFLEREHENAIT